MNRVNQLIRDVENLKGSGLWAQLGQYDDRLDRIDSKLDNHEAKFTKLLRSLVYEGFRQGNSGESESSNPPTPGDVFSSVPLCKCLVFN